MPSVSLSDLPSSRVITLAGDGGRATVHEHGAHVTSWVPTRDGTDALFLSRLARLDGRSAIRGGVPVIFPQFGPGPLPKHGFARTARWTLADSGTDEGAAWARLELRDDAATRATWPHAFAMSLVVRAGDALRLTLAVENTGDAPFHFTGALHTYFRVRDVESVAVTGLEGRRYRDQLARTEATESSRPVRLAGPVDRVYVDVPGPLRIRDEASGRTLRLTTRGFADAVLWNPWIDGARALDDLGDDEWREMLCLEAAVAAKPVVVRPGERWEGEQEVSVE
jgi:glucose-6-phosphate 1-epimerase